MCLSNLTARSNSDGTAPRPTAGERCAGNSIRECMDADGTYVLVCTGVDVTGAERQKTLGLLTQHFKDYESPRSRDQLQETESERQYLRDDESACALVEFPARR